MREHRYDVTVRWTGNTGDGTTNYRAYGRGNEAVVEGKPTLYGSADPAFRGDRAQWNPEELLVAALSQCHLLSYLAACALSDVVVTGYEDVAHGRMEEARGAGRFVEVVLRPVVTVADASMVEKARALHTKAHEVCFIANSVNFPVRHEPRILVEGAGADQPEG